MLVEAGIIREYAEKWLSSPIWYETDMSNT